MKRAAQVLVATMMMALALPVSAHADDICGPGMHWDWKHEICAPFVVAPPPPCYLCTPYPPGGTP